MRWKIAKKLIVKKFTLKSLTKKPGLVYSKIIGCVLFLGGFHCRPFFCSSSSPLSDWQFQGPCAFVDTANHLQRYIASVNVSICYHIFIILFPHQPDHRDPPLLSRIQRYVCILYLGVRPYQFQHKPPLLDFDKAEHHNRNIKKPAPKSIRCRLCKIFGNPLSVSVHP